VSRGDRVHRSVGGGRLLINRY